MLRMINPVDVVVAVNIAAANYMTCLMAAMAAVRLQPALPSEAAHPAVLDA
jgi:hypothetical protein